MNTMFNKNRALAGVTFILLAVTIMANTLNFNIDGFGHSGGFYQNLFSKFQNQTTFMTYDYEKAWAEVQQFENDGLPKSAHEKTKVILNEARADGSDDQFIKAMVYCGKYINQTEEDGIIEAMKFFETELGLADTPKKEILQSMLGEMYARYLDNNYWQFSGRTQTFNFESGDINTWTIDQLIAKSNEYYLASVLNENTKSVSIRDFAILLEGEKHQDWLRPTLFDFLAHRAIDHFSNDRNYLTQPAYKFEIDGKEAFADASDFVKWEITTPDSNSLKRQALLLFQKLLSFRGNNEPASLDADLKRLHFAKSNSVAEDKDELYLQALQRLQNQHKGNTGQAEINYLIAQQFSELGADYTPPRFGEEDFGVNKDLLKKAVDLCNQTMKEFPESIGASKCEALANSIQETQIALQLELVNLPGKPFLGNLSFKNLEKVFLRIVPFTTDQKEDFEKILQENNGQQKAIEFLRNSEAVKEWSVKLPNDHLFHSHNVEIPFEQLSIGLYAVLIADNEKFEAEKGAIGYVFSHVSNIGYWERRGSGEPSEFVVFDRNTGSPIEGACVEFWVESYNSVFRKYVSKKKSSETTNKNGMVRTDLTNREDRTFFIKIKNGKDELVTDNRFYNNLYTSNSNPYQQTHLFLDRAIYRPGQTIFFKGLALEFDGNRMPTISKDASVEVILRDANYQEVSKLKFRTNEFGTFSGQFIAPRGGLLGNMQLVSSFGNSTKHFKVEEYKRPKFEVKFEPVTESYKIDELVKVEGKAIAYAGNNIDGAKVSWRVVRETHFPWWYWRKWSYIPWQGESMEIANGISKTNENGMFEIEFQAIPDKKIPASQKPEFHYTLYADVTDITGETQSNQSSVKVGFVAMNIEVSVPEKTAINDLKEIAFSTKNLNGEFEPATGVIKIEKLEAHAVVYKNRYWQEPDMQIISEKEFKKNYPNFAWQQEDQPEKWEIEKSIIEQKFDSAKSSVVSLDDLKLKQGWYRITLNTADKYGEEIEVVKHVQGFNFEVNNAAFNEVLYHQLEETTYEPGDLATIQIGAANKQPVLLEIFRGNTVLEKKWLHVKGVHTESLPISEVDRGGLSFQLSYAAFNRSFNEAQGINVPWSNKELTFEFGSFRDKMQPGAEEEWTVKIKGPKGEQVSAEMVAGMYDASLDAFATNSWGLNIFPTNRTHVQYSSHTYSSIGQRLLSCAKPLPSTLPWKDRKYDNLNWFNWFFQSYSPQLYMRSESMMNGFGGELEEVVVAGNGRGKTKKMNTAAYADSMPEEGMPPVAAPEDNNEPDFPPAKDTPPAVKVRTNLNETVFFYPNLMTDEEGNVVIKFKMNEALTRWKFLGLAHTQDLASAVTTKEVVTQKELMVVPNPPRFFRENDEIEFTAKVVNLTDKPLQGNAELQLVNPMNSMPVYKWLDNPQFNLSFKVEANQSTRLAWRFKIPDAAEVPVIEHTVIAVAGNYSDGEKSAAPVLTNRMLVTETKPLPVRGKETKGFVFNSLKNNDSPTLRHQSLTLEFTQNPAWYAVQSLPYLMEYPHECTEQVFSRFYANSLATSVANSHPKLKSVFEKWKNYEPDALLSNLSKNQELKSALLEETPWVLNALSEETQKQNIGLLFDLNRMSNEMEATVKKLADRQMPGGGWAWFPGGRDSWYITQYIVEGFAHLQKLNALEMGHDGRISSMIEISVKYCDERLLESYEELEKSVKEGKAKWEDDHMSYLISHYLYTRSFFLEKNEGGISKSSLYFPLDGKVENAHAYYLEQAKKYWLNKGIYSEGMLALALHRNGDFVTAKKITNSLKERSLNHEELGMYWKMPSGWWWYQAPIETHTLMIEVFNDVAKDNQAVDDMKTWLLKNKQTNHWKTTKATANAVYALLNSGDNWLMDDQPISISLGNPAASGTDFWNAEIARAQSSAESGTGYFKVNFEGENISKEMADIQVTNPNNVVAWGALYWQYFEQLDKIESFEETPLTIKKQLFRVSNAATGEVMEPVKENDQLAVGEKLMVRIELNVDRDMEYVHMKDMRASGFEPVNVLSQYKWQDGLGYYESTRDAATNFFFTWLPKGTYVFEYPLRVVHNGNFSNGVTTIQSMYAPEFTSHSEGVRVQVGN